MNLYGILYELQMLRTWTSAMKCWWMPAYPTMKEWIFGNSYPSTGTLIGKISNLHLQLYIKMSCDFHYVFCIDYLPTYFAKRIGKYRGNFFLKKNLSVFKAKYYSRMECKQGLGFYFCLKNRNVQNQIWQRFTATKLYVIWFITFST